MPLCLLFRCRVDFGIVDLVEREGKVRKLAVAHSDPKKSKLIEEFSPSILLIQMLRMGIQE